MNGNARWRIDVHAQRTQLGMSELCPRLKRPDRPILHGRIQLRKAVWPTLDRLIRRVRTCRGSADLGAGIRLVPPLRDVHGPALAADYAARS
jgi:hypothetical protein